MTPSADEMGAMRSRIGVAAATAVTALVATTATPASTSTVPPGWKVIDAHIVKGMYPVALTSTFRLDHPGRVAVRIIGPTGKRLLVSWSANCRKGVTTETNTGTSTGVGVAMVVMRLPFGRPDYCMVEGAGRLNELPRVTSTPPTVRLQIQLLAHS